MGMLFSLLTVRGCRFSPVGSSVFGRMYPGAEIVPALKTKQAPQSFAGPVFSGAPGEIRTPGLLIRSQTLYPAELQAHL